MAHTFSQELRPRDIRRQSCSSGRPTTCVGGPRAFRFVAQGARLPGAKRTAKQKSAGPWGFFPRVLWLKRDLSQSQRVASIQPRRGGRI